MAEILHHRLDVKHLKIMGQPDNLPINQVVSRISAINSRKKVYPFGIVFPQACHCALCLTYKSTINVDVFQFETVWFPNSSPATNTLEISHQPQTIINARQQNQEFPFTCKNSMSIFLVPLGTKSGRWKETSSISPKDNQIAKLRSVISIIFFPWFHLYLGQVGG